MEKLKVGVIGLGHNGMAFCERYAKNPKTTLVAVCDVNNDRLETAVERFNVKGYCDYSILEDEQIDLISIHTPDHLHKEPFILAAKKGFHVFVEKPMADNETDIREMVAISDIRTDKVFSVGHVLRFSEYFKLVKKWIDMGLLGEITYVEGDYIHDLRYQQYMEEWKLSKEIPILGGGCHPIDLLRWFIGDISEVMSFSNHIAYPEMREDTSMVSVFRFKSGCVGKVTSLYGNPSPNPEVYNLSIYGTKGAIVRGKVSFDGLGEKWMDIPSAHDKTHDYMPEIDHIAECIIKGKQCLVTPREAAKASIAGLYAMQSATEKRVLTIPEV